MDFQSGKSDLIVSSLRDFFSSQLYSVVESQRAQVSQQVLGYMTELLVDFQNSEKFFSQESSIPVLTDILVDMAEADSARRITLLKQMADTSLMLSGYFPEALERRCLNAGYYQKMGESAYIQLGQLSHYSAVYFELGERFSLFRDILNELSDRTQARTYTVEQLLQNYRETLSERILEKLKKQGIIPFESKKDPFNS